jgi:Mg2+-importing ATPase
MGDGINDAAALGDADVGISVDTAVDIAKERADIILLENDLNVLYKGVWYGRRTFGNIIKYIKMAASSNFGNMFSVLGASALLPFLPMLPIQILVQNLLYDFSQVSIPWDIMDREYLTTPRKWDSNSIGRFMLFIGPVSSIFDYIMFAVLFFFFKANTPEHQSLFQSGWFIEGLLSQTLIVHMIRTRKIPFIQSWAAAPVVALTTLIMLIGIYIPFSPMAGAFKMQALPMSYFPWLFGILLGYCLLTQIVKNWFIRKFDQWL